MTNKQSHLEMIQGIILRLSNNSFLLKGWSVTLVSAMFALAAKNTNIFYVYLAYFPAISFWILDGYFLYQEKLFRKLYDSVRVLPEDQIDYSMDTSIVTDKSISWFQIIISKTIISFHFVIIVSVIIVMVISAYIN